MNSRLIFAIINTLEFNSYYYNNVITGEKLCGFFFFFVLRPFPTVLRNKITSRGGVFFRVLVLQVFKTLIRITKPYRNAFTRTFYRVRTRTNTGVFFTIFGVPTVYTIIGRFASGIEYRFGRRFVLYHANGHVKKSRILFNNNETIERVRGATVK